MADGHFTDKFGDTLDASYSGDDILLEANGLLGKQFDLVLDYDTAEALRDHLTELLDHPPVNDPD